MGTFLNLYCTIFGDEIPGLLNYDALLFCPKCVKYFNKTIVTLNGNQHNKTACGKCGNPLVDLTSQAIENSLCPRCKKPNLTEIPIEGIVD